MGFARFFFDPFNLGVADPKFAKWASIQISKTLVELGICQSDR